MNLLEEAEPDPILAGADYTECEEVTEQLESTPELLDAVRTPTNDPGGMDWKATWD